MGIRSKPLAAHTCGRQWYYHACLMDCLLQATHIMCTHPQVHVMFTPLECLPCVAGCDDHLCRQVGGPAQEQARAVDVTLVFRLLSFIQLVSGHTVGVCGRLRWVAIVPQVRLLLLLPLSSYVVGWCLLLRRWVCNVLLCCVCARACCPDTGRMGC